MVKEKQNNKNHSLHHGFGVFESALLLSFFAHAHGGFCTGKIEALAKFIVYRKKKKNLKNWKFIRNK